MVDIRSCRLLVQNQVLMKNDNLIYLTVWKWMTLRCRSWKTIRLKSLSFNFSLYILKRFSKCNVYVTFWSIAVFLIHYFNFTMCLGLITTENGQKIQLIKVIYKNRHKEYIPILFCKFMLICRMQHIKNYFSLLQIDYRCEI